MQNRIVLAGGWAQKISVSPFRSPRGLFCVLVDHFFDRSKRYRRIYSAKSLMAASRSRAATFSKKAGACAGFTFFRFRPGFSGVFLFF